MRTYLQFYLQWSQRCRSYWLLHGVWAWPLAQVGVYPQLRSLESRNHSGEERVLSAPDTRWIRRVSASPREHHVLLTSRVVFFCIVSRQSYSNDVSGGGKKIKEQRCRQTDGGQERGGEVGPGNMNGQYKKTLMLSVTKKHS